MKLVPIHGPRVLERAREGPDSNDEQELGLPAVTARGDRQITPETWG